MVKNLNNKKFEINRAIQLIRSVKEKFAFDLKGLTVLTEVGSNYYLYSPIIPLLCGAEKVYAFVKDTPYGKGEDIKADCISIAKELGIEDRLEIGINILDNNWITKADIITNSGMLRPFDSQKLSHCKIGAVLPLMFEAWEIRAQDLDISYCKQNNIKVAGTWENHPLIKVFDYVEMLCLKMAFEAGFEVKGNSIFVWSNDHFGEKIKYSFNQNGALSCYLSIDKELLFKHAGELDFIFIADYDEKQNYFDLLDLAILVKINPNLCIIHLYGNIEMDKILELGIHLYPLKDGRAELMTYTLAHVGITPIINLQVAGYKVATELLSDNYSDLTQLIK
jgi:hypothetical protein